MDYTRLPESPGDSAEDVPEGIDETQRFDKNLIEKQGEEYFVEEAFAGVEVPPWWDQLTLRGFVVSAVVGTVFCVICHKLNLTVGILPSLNVAAGLLGYFFVKSWTVVLPMFGLSSKPFTRQENTVIQTCVVACYEIAFSGGFGHYILAMSPKTYDILGPNYPGNRAEDVKDPALGWIIGFLFAVSFVGLFSLVPLRKIMILDYKLTYPSGTATAVLINSFHTPQGAEGAAFYFDFSMTYIGVGMICPHIVNCSVLLGAVISWGFMWPLISTQEGIWYPEGLSKSDFQGLYGYKVFIAIALVLGDGLYNFAKILFATGKNVYLQSRSQQQLPLVTGEATEGLSDDDKLRSGVFLKDGVPTWIAISGYIGFAAVAVAVIPMMFSPAKWYYVLTAYILAPVLAFCNAYGTGLTDWGLPTTYGKLGLFVFAGWAGSNGGGVIAGLVICGVMMSIVSTAGDLMQDFRTGYLTLSSPRSMFVSQLVGTVMGCILAPLTFWLFWISFDIGNPEGEYKGPNGVLFRTMAIVCSEGLSTLPPHCLELCLVAFALAILVNISRDVVPRSIGQYIPIPMAMAIPFYVGAYFAIDMFVGTVILFIWQMHNKKEADVYAPAVASGLICGEGIWSVPAAVLSLAKISPPICMMFVKATDAAGFHT